MNHNQNAVAIFNKLAEGYQQKFMNVDLYRESFNFFCDHLQIKDPEILELACGPGNITQYLLQKRPDLKILGIDLAPNMIELAKINNPGCQFEVRDGRDLSFLDKKLDGLVCGFFFPYLNKAETLQLIEEVSAKLRSGGLFYISTMEDNYSKSGFKKGSSGDEIYMHYHEAEYLIHALKKHQLKVLKIDRAKYVYQGEPTTDLIIIAKKEQELGIV